MYRLYSHSDELELCGDSSNCCVTAIETTLTLMSEGSAVRDVTYFIVTSSGKNIYFFLK